MATERAVRGAARSPTRSSRRAIPAEHSKTGLVPLAADRADDGQRSADQRRPVADPAAARRHAAGARRTSSTTTSTTAKATRSGCEGESSADILLRAPIADRSGRRGRRDVAVAAHRQADGDPRDRAEGQPRRDRHRRRAARSSTWRRARSRPSSWRCRTACRTSTTRDFPTNYVYVVSISSSTRLRADVRERRARQPLPRRDGAADSDLRRRPVVATICVVTSSPPFAEGGHLVMARELVRALREEGHDTGLVVTPQNRSAGRAAPTWRHGAPTSSSRTRSARSIR